jgi:excisionase family DNA binding protein
MSHGHLGTILGVLGVLLAAGLDAAAGLAGALAYICIRVALSADATDPRASRLHRHPMPAQADTATSPAALPPSPLSEPLLDARAAAALLSVRPSWIYEAVRAGRLPHLKVGRHVRFLRSDLERWVVDQRRAC